MVQIISNTLHDRCRRVPQLSRTAFVNTRFHKMLYSTVPNMLAPEKSVNQVLHILTAQLLLQIPTRVSSQVKHIHWKFSGCNIQASHCCGFSFSNKQSLHEATEPFCIAVRVHDRDGLATKHSCLHDMLHLFLGAILLHACQIVDIKELNILAKQCTCHLSAVHVTYQHLNVIRVISHWLKYVRATMYTMLVSPRPAKQHTASMPTQAASGYRGSCNGA